MPHWAKESEMALEIKSGIGDRPAIYLYGVIGEQYDGITADEFRRAVDTIPPSRDIQLRIHSPGGSYPEAVAMYSNLLRRKGDTYVSIDGMAASGGSLVAMAGKTIEIANGGVFMAHDMRGSLRDGTEAEFRQKADVMSQMNDEMVKIYARRWKGTEVDLRAQMNKELWLSGRQAIDAGFADSMSNESALAALVDFSMFSYSHIPDEVIEAQKAGFPLLEARKESVSELLEQLA
jgi:ATP-dependent protease ClpP protease subunit